MPGDSDPLHKTLVARFDGGVDRTTWAEGCVPLNGIGEAVQLPQVHVVDAEPVQRPMELLARAFGVAGAGLGGEEETIRLALQPRGDAKLRVAVAGGGID